jgi:hypothetical protein
VSTITTSLLCYTSQPRGLEIAFPRHLPSQPTHVLLTASLNQQAQSFFDSRAFGACAAAPHGLAHQPIINIDVRPHEYPDV